MRRPGGADVADGSGSLPLLTVKQVFRDVPPTLLEQAVKWCIEAYYRPDASSVASADRLDDRSD